MNDAPALFNYRSMPEVFKFQTWRPKELQEVEEFVQKNSNQIENTPDTWLQLAVCTGNDQLIGDIGIHFLADAFQVEIGYTVSPNYQGKGYAVEAVKAVLDHLFGDLQKHRISASVDPENVRSIRLLEKIGFRKEAHFVKSFQVDGEWLDDCIYALLREEWASKTVKNEV
jgi:RimJ/RimL family protein N-acetyltransferase